MNSFLNRDNGTGQTIEDPNEKRIENSQVYPFADFYTHRKPNQYNSVHIGYHIEEQEIKVSYSRNSSKRIWKDPDTKRCFRYLLHGYTSSLCNVHYGIRDISNQDQARPEEVRTSDLYHKRDEFLKELTYCFIDSLRPLKRLSNKFLDNPAEHLKDPYLFSLRSIGRDKDIVAYYAGSTEEQKHLFIPFFGLDDKRYIALDETCLTKHLRLESDIPDKVASITPCSSLYRRRSDNCLFICYSESDDTEKLIPLDSLYRSTDIPEDEKRRFQERLNNTYLLEQPLVLTNSTHKLSIKKGSDSSYYFCEQPIHLSISSKMSDYKLLSESNRNNLLKDFGNDWNIHVILRAIDHNTKMMKTEKNRTIGSRKRIR